VNVSFGDGSSIVVNNINASSPFVNITHNYTQVGTFYIVATPLVSNLTWTVINNNITVNVAAPPVYPCNYKIK
jgi:hypothetical protein